MNELSQEKSLSVLMKEAANNTLEAARGYKDMRNILAVGGTATTALLNFTEGVRSMATPDQIKFNAAGLAVTALSALGMEYGNRKRERWAYDTENLSKDLKDLNF